MQNACVALTHRTRHLKNRSHLLLFSGLSQIPFLINVSTSFCPHPLYPLQRLDINNRSPLQSKFTVVLSLVTRKDACCRSSSTNRNLFVCLRKLLMLVLMLIKLIRSPVFQHALLDYFKITGSPPTIICSDIDSSGNILVFAVWQPKDFSTL